MPQKQRGAGPVRIRRANLLIAELRHRLGGLESISHGVRPHFDVAQMKVSYVLEQATTVSLELSMIVGEVACHLLAALPGSAEEEASARSKAERSHPLEWLRLIKEIDDERPVSMVHAVRLRGPFAAATLQAGSTEWASCTGEVVLTLWPMVPTHAALAALCDWSSDSGRGRYAPEWAPLASLADLEASAPTALPLEHEFQFGPGTGPLAGLPVLATLEAICDYVGAEVTTPTRLLI